MARRPTPPDPRQADLQSLLNAPAPGSFNMGLVLRNALARALKATPLSRVDVAARMTELLFGDDGEGEITKAQLDKWTAPGSGDWRFPAEYLPAFVEATGAPWLHHLLAEKNGLRLQDGEQTVLAAIAALRLKEQYLKAERQKLERQIPASLRSQGEAADA